MQNELLLSVNEISKKYNNFIALKNINLKLFKGDKLALFGDNGSGKSTLLSIISGMNSQNSGEILYKGHKITKSDKLKIGFVPQNPIFIEDLSVADNLKLWSGIYNMKIEYTLKTIPSFLNINEILQKKVSSLSGGMKKKLSIAVCFLNEPELILLDEPFAALDFKTIENLKGYLNSLQKVSMIFSGHDTDDILNICNKIVFMKHGEIKGEKLDMDESFDIFSEYNKI